MTVTRVLDCLRQVVAWYTVGDDSLWGHPRTHYHVAGSMLLRCAFGVKPIER